MDRYVRHPDALSVTSGPERKNIATNADEASFRCIEDQIRTRSPAHLSPAAIIGEEAPHPLETRARGPAQGDPRPRHLGVDFEEHRALTVHRDLDSCGPFKIRRFSGESEGNLSAVQGYLCFKITIRELVH